MQGSRSFSETGYHERPPCPPSRPTHTQLLTQRDLLQIMTFFNLIHLRILHDTPYKRRTEMQQPRYCHLPLLPLTSHVNIQIIDWCCGCLFGFTSSPSYSVRFIKFSRLGLAFTRSNREIIDIGCFRLDIGTL